MASHGKANVVAEINDETIKPCLFPIIQGHTFVEIPEMSQTVNGGTLLVPARKILVPERQTLIADLSHRLDIPEAQRFLPLHSPMKSYTPISNADVWEGLKEATKDLGAKIVNAGTLNSCAKFYVCADIGGAESKINGDGFLSYLCFITSHDGTLAAQAYDSTVRIVCQNTLRWSLEAAGEVGFKVYHTKNAPRAMKKFPELLNAILAGRAQFKNQMEFFASVECSREQAFNIALAFLCGSSDEKKKNVEKDEKVSTQSYNMAEEIAHLFEKGKGNNGKTMYDLLNAVTECYTHGSGTGKKTDQVAKAFKANFGGAAEKKNDFVNFLTGDMIIAAEKGKRLLSIHRALVG